MAGTEQQRDFFISFAQDDRAWAEWIAWQLDEAGYTTILHVWDIQPGSNFVYEVDEALRRTERVIVVLSPAYLASEYAFFEWTSTFRYDPKGEHRRLIPVRIAPCEVEGIIGSIVYIDLVNCDEATAHERLLKGIKLGRAKPKHPPTTVETSPELIRFPGTLPPLWNVPYARNPYFTDRELDLKYLASTLQAGEPAALISPLALSGLGGIGKTQIAIEYAYRYHQNYNAVFWLQAENLESLIAGFVDIAHLLDLPDRHEQDQAIRVQAVHQWLQTHDKWLLILDNVEETKIINDFLPPARPRGHILLTTRSQLMDNSVQRVEVEALDVEHASRLLLRRAGLITHDASLEPMSTEVTIAKILSQMMGGFPLALAQVGAYIKETQCGLSGYLDLYQERHTELLKRGDRFALDHPQSVTATLTLSFKKVESANLAAADLLRLCAFLHPDGIPEEFLSEGTFDPGSGLESLAGNLLELDRAIAELSKFSLVRRDPDSKLLNMHRLVQAVIKDGMDVETQRQWAERAVRLVSKAFPYAEFRAWPQCERYIPHAQLCAQLIAEHSLVFPEAAQLLNLAGGYLNIRAHYSQAEQFYLRALAIYEQCKGPSHSDTAITLNNLATLYIDQGRFAEAEQFYRRTLEIDEHIFGREHPEIVIDLNNMAVLNKLQGRYEEAKQLFYRALFINELHLGLTHPDTATCLNNIGSLFLEQGMYEEAERLYQRALAIREQQLGPMHPDTAASLNDLAVLYKRQGQYTQAEEAYQRALTIFEQCLGPLHPYTATCLNNMAVLYYKQGQLERAQQFMKRSLIIYQELLGSQHPASVQTQKNLTTLMQMAPSEESLQSKMSKTGAAEKRFPLDMLIEALVGGKNGITAEEGCSNDE